MIVFDAIKLADGSHKEGRRFVFVAPLPDDRAGIDAMTAAAIGSQWRITAIELDEDGNAPEFKKGNENDITSPA
jgi:hypothetical protein